MTTLVIGANSDVAKAVVRALSSDGVDNDFILASRDMAELERFQADCHIRFPENQYDSKALDVLETDQHAKWFSGLPSAPSRVIVAAGAMCDESRASEDFEYAKRTVEVNFLALISLIELAVSEMDASGQVVVLSSVAGDRGRKKNMFYGCAKAGLTAYLSGLRQRVYPRGINVLTVMPGSMQTKMSKGEETFPFLTATPEQAARTIVAAMKKRKDLIYVKPVWRLIMTIIHFIPEPLFKRLNF